MVPPLSEALPLVAERIRTAGRIALFLDFDGTLTPIVEDPAAAQLESGTLETLRRLAHQPGLVTTLISGRAVEDLYARIRVEGLIYAGNHGLEIFGHDLRFVEPAAAARRDHLKRLSEALAIRLAPIHGVWVEDKGLTTSIHFRQAAQTDIPLVEDAVRTSVATRGDWFRLNLGKKVLEIVPRTSWHKGAAVQWINRRLGTDNVLSIYCGDDASDEDAFAVLKDAITVKVGGMLVTCARYRVPDPATVHQFLLWLEQQQVPSLY